MIGKMIWLYNISDAMKSGRIFEFNPNFFIKNINGESIINNANVDPNVMILDIV